MMVSGIDNDEEPGVEPGVENEDVRGCEKAGAKYPVIRSSLASA